MPAPLHLDRTAVKAYTLAHGFAAAARQFRLAPSTVRSWSRHDPAGPWRPKSSAPAEPRSLEEIGRRSRLVLAQGLEKGVEAIRTMNGAEILAGAQQIRTIAAALDLTHDWKSDQQLVPPGLPLVNLEILDLHILPLAAPQTET